MRRKRSGWRLSVLTAALAFAGSVSARAELWISEYVDGSARNQALELYNPGPTAVDLNLGAYSLQIFRPGRATASRTIPLTGVIAPGGTFVIAHPLAALPGVKVGQTSGSLRFDGDTAVILRHNTTVIDSVGQVGLNPGTLRRKTTVCVGDAVVNPAFPPSTQWNRFAVDTFGGLGSHTASCTGSRIRQDPESGDLTDAAVPAADLDSLTEPTSATGPSLTSGNPLASSTQSETITYSYDARGRLVKVEHAGTVNNTLQANYSYDKAGNRASVIVTGSPN